MRTFKLMRDVDEGGVSGVGHVADGVQFHNGKIAVSWRTQYTSVAIYDDIETCRRIHGHDGKTRIQWDDLCPGFHRDGRGVLYECQGQPGHRGPHFCEGMVFDSAAANDERLRMADMVG